MLMMDIEVPNDKRKGGRSVHKTTLSICVKRALKTAHKKVDNE